MSTTALKAAADPNRPRNFPAMIEQLKKQVALALPKHLNADRMARIALTAFNQNRDLAECDPTSVFAAVVVASQLGLEPGVNGQGYLVPYNSKNGKLCQFIPGWKGLVDLAQRSGRASVWTGAVFEGDEFDYAYGTKPDIHHVTRGEDDPKKLQYTYAVGWVKGAEYPIIDVWPLAKILRHRDRFNKVGGRHYSFQNVEMYARKVPLLQVLKYMPSTVELTAATSLEHASQQPQADAIDLQKAIDGSFMQAPPMPDPQDEPPQAGAQAEQQTQQPTGTESSL